MDLKLSDGLLPGRRR
jgi:hypothetical protein